MPRRRREPLTMSRRYFRRHIRRGPSMQFPMRLCMQSDYRSDAIRTQFGCSLATVNAALYTGRLQLGCRSEAIPPQLMRLGIRSEYRHKRI